MWIVCPMYVYVYNLCSVGAYLCCCRWRLVKIIQAMHFLSTDFSESLTVCWFTADFVEWTHACCVAYRSHFTTCFLSEMFVKMCFSAPWLRGANRVKLDQRMQDTAAYGSFFSAKSFTLTRGQHDVVCYDHYFRHCRRHRHNKEIALPNLKCHLITMWSMCSCSISFRSEQIRGALRDRSLPAGDQGQSRWRDLMLRMGKICWARADVWRLFCKVTTKKMSPENWGPVDMCWK